MACSRKSGVVSMSTVLPSYSTSTEGRVRWSRGSEEWHTAQSQPMVGTPIDVPLPSTVSLAFIVNGFPFPYRSLRRPSHRIGHFDVGHAQLVKNVLEKVFFGGSQVAFGFFRQQTQGVDGLSRSDEVKTRLAALFLHQSKLQHGRHVKRSHETL